MALFSEITNRPSNIVCIGVRWNQLGQMGGTPGVGVLIGRCVGKGVGLIPGVDSITPISHTFA